MINRPGFNLKDTKNQFASIEKVEKDFQYLRKPAHVPQAYEIALKEMARRRQYRLTVDAVYSKLKDFIREEREKRTEFRDNHHTYLPSSFCPQLKDSVQELKLEGPSSEMEFAQFPEINVEIQNAKFFNLSNSAEGQLSCAQ